nr:MAG: hypothetical protein [Bacteriophage sp.]
MLTIDFPDKSVTYDTFVRDVASSVVRMLADTHNDPEMVSRLGVAMWIDGASRVK